MCVAIVIVMLLTIFGSLTYLAVVVEHNLVYVISGLATALIFIMGYATVKTLNAKE
jgi:hypothetical protein